MKKSVAFVTGGSGQTGSYLVEQLLESGWTVHCLARPQSAFVAGTARHPSFRAHLCDDKSFIINDLLNEINPSHVFHLAAQSSPGASFRRPEETFQANTILTLQLLEACRKLENPPRFLHASTGEIFGIPDSLPLNETFPLRPVSPYGVSKTAAHQLVQIYRQCHGMHAFNAILLSHESPRRGESFVTRKVARAAARISLGLEKELVLGNTEPKRDWGWAPDYARGCILALTQEVPAQDFLFATGVSHSVRDWVEACFSHLGLKWAEYVRSDPAFARPSDISEMRGDASRARALLNWCPTLDFREIAARMVDAEVASIKHPVVQGKHP